MKLKVNTKSGIFNRFFSDPGTLIKTAIIFYCLFTVFIFSIPFFGDHVTLVSWPASYYYDSGFATFFLPETIATGHPPFYPLVIAMVWQLFGKSLIVTHLITLFSILFLLTQFYIFSKKFIKEQHHGVAIILFMFYPVLLAQTAAMSIDVLLTGIFFWGMNAIHSKNKKQLFFAVLFAVLISLRGWMVVMSFFIIEMVINRFTIGKIFKNGFIYLLALIPCIVYFIFQYRNSGWWITPTGGNWSKGRELVSGQLIFGKLFEFSIRNIEFGMIIPVLVIMVYILKNAHKLILNDLYKVILITIAVFAFFMLPFRNAILIRYFMPVHLLVLILFVKILSEYFTALKKNIIIAITCGLFVAHHFFAYPQLKTSVFEYSWGDGSLAHLSYFTYRNQGAEYLKQNNINPNKVYTGFPEYKPFNLTNLNQNTFYYNKLELGDLEHYEFVIYSNIMNEIPKEAEMELKNNWIRLKSWYSYPVEYIIFKRPGNE